MWASASVCWLLTHLKATWSWAFLIIMCTHNMQLFGLSYTQTHSEPPQESSLYLCDLLTSQARVQNHLIFSNGWGPVWTAWTVLLLAARLTDLWMSSPSGLTLFVIKMSQQQHESKKKKKKEIVYFTSTEPRKMVWGWPARADWTFWI